MANDNTNFNIDSLLDGQLDDLKDLPEFKPFPAGTHRVIVTMIDKATDKKNWINNHPGFELKMIGQETIELANPEDTPLNIGDATSILFLLDNDIGQGNFKKVMKAVAEKLGNKPVRELVAEMKNLEVLMVTKVRQNKDKTQSYTDMVEISVM